MPKLRIVLEHDTESKFTMEVTGTGHESQLLGMLAWATIQVSKSVEERIAIDHSTFPRNPPQTKKTAKKGVKA